MDHPQHPDLPELVEQVVHHATTLTKTHDHSSWVIAELELPIQNLSDQYSQVPSHGYEFDGMLRVFLYKHIGGFSDSELARRLAQWPYLRLRFGLERGPTQQTLSYTWRNRFTPELRDFITSAANGIQTRPTNNTLDSPEQPTDTHSTGSGSEDTPHRELGRV